jgi:ribonuclease VapC
MVIDTSAILAALFAEPDGDAFLVKIVEAPTRLMSAVSAVEAGIVADRHPNPKKAEALANLIAELGIEIEPVTAEQARLARLAYRRYGNGRHPANLNFGDCFAYALAKVTDLPLLFKGGDFARTDVRQA